MALRDDSVRSLIAQKLTDEVVLKNQADLIAARPIIESVASDVVGGRAFTNLFRKAVRDVHRALFKRDKNTVTLTIADVGAVLAAALEQVRPELARKLQSTERVELVERNIGSLSATLANIAERVQLLAVLLLVLSLVLVAGALLLAPDRRQAVVELGVAAAVGGRAARGGVLRRALDRGGPRRRAGRAGGGAGGLGRLPGRPSHRRLDTRRVRRGGGGRGGVADRASSLRRATARGRPLACNGAAASRAAGAAAEWPSRRPEWWCSSRETPSLLS